MTFTLSDYNSSVLRLVTLPNLLLTWALSSSPLASSSSPSTSTSDNTTPSGDLELTPDLLAAFTNTLARTQINLTFLSGPWSPAQLAQIPPSSPDLATLVLASETIYSPASTSAFVDILVPLLQRTRMAKALVAAKKVYFGVGGSVDLFKEACAERGVLAAEVENAGIAAMGEGVGRSLVEVQMF